MPINIKILEDGQSTDITRMTAKKIFKLLKDNKDKAYSIIDIQNEFTMAYARVTSAIRTLKRVYPKNIQYKWVRLAGYNRMVYYAYKEEKK